MSELISSGVELMIAGMGIVYLFLIMLVYAINIMSTVVQRYFHEPPVTAATLPQTPASSAEKATVAAITAAIHHYRQTALDNSQQKN